MNNIAYLITALSIIGTIANSFQKRWCFIIWAFTNSFWCVFNFINKQYAQSLLYLFNLFLSFNGLINWKKKQQANPYTKNTEQEKTALSDDEAEKLKDEIRKWQNAYYENDIKWEQQYNDEVRNFELQIQQIQNSINQLTAGKERKR